MNQWTLPPPHHPALFFLLFAPPPSFIYSSFSYCHLLHPAPLVPYLQTWLSVCLSGVLSQQSAPFSQHTFCFAVWSLVYLQLSIRSSSVLHKPHFSPLQSPLHSFSISSSHPCFISHLDKWQVLVSVLCGCVSAADMRKNNEFGSTNYRGKSCKRSVHVLSLVGDHSENDRSFNPNEPKIKIKPLVKCFRKFFFLGS